MISLIILLRYGTNLTQDDITPIEKELTLDSILKTVSAVTGISTELMKSKSRYPETVLARHLYFYFAKKHDKFTLEKMGLKVNKNHDTAINGIRKIEQYIDGDEEKVIEFINQINEML